MVSELASHEEGKEQWSVRLGDLSGFKRGLRSDGRARLTIATMAGKGR